MAREGRSDAAGELRLKVEDANRRWNVLLQSIKLILSRLNHTVNLTTDFDASLSVLTTWLHDLDIRLTQLEHLSEDDAVSKWTTIKVWLHA